MKQLWPLAPAAAFLCSGKIAEMNKCFVSHGSKFAVWLLVSNLILFSCCQLFIILENVL